jgi:cytochrome P450
VVPAGGIDIEGSFIPEGTWIGMAPWALGRRKETFGEDAEIFGPERWLEDEDRMRGWERSDVTFGSGAWVCLDKNLAMMEICKVVIEVCSPKAHFLYYSSSTISLRLFGL